MATAHNVSGAFTMVRVEDAAGLPRVVAAMNPKAHWTDVDDLPEWDVYEYRDEESAPDDYVMAFALEADEHDAVWTGAFMHLDSDEPAVAKVSVAGGTVVVHDVHEDAVSLWMGPDSLERWRAKCDAIVRDLECAEDYTEPLAAFACPSCGVQVGVHEDDAADAQPLEWSSAECPACGNLAVVMPSVDSPGEGWVRSWGFEPSPDGDPRLPEDAQERGTMTNLTVRLVEVGTPVGGAA